MNLRMLDLFCGGGGSNRKPSSLDQARGVMGIDWMTRAELSEAVPPAYTRFLVAQLLPSLMKAAT